jgi:hypothetical protein
MLPNIIVDQAKLFDLPMPTKCSRARSIESSRCDNPTCFERFTLSYEQCQERGCGRTWRWMFQRLTGGHTRP